MKPLTSFKKTLPEQKNQVAERVRFELTVVLPTHAFQACALNHSAISPPSRQCDRARRTFQCKTRRGHDLEFCGARLCAHRQPQRVENAAAGFRSRAPFKTPATCRRAFFLATFPRWEK